ncbi:hypothetical protein CHLRE_12g539201v5 [Chlamydomonas reinhardtii]|uniref:Uncharacterized protein n=1 Tax=Chlamydomonas reinhardtii TaxID=3055 RepID=A0A2K3D5D8_CHLRE|nr:uncharacterized protein CHLRE_12g539201v5 [Chlamydomonas reinhardtii]PNW75746.1 hypothetical protein CHLRE_12g539201v5 [Chlamydomonas reinhardtii]
MALDDGCYCACRQRHLVHWHGLAVLLRRVIAVAHDEGSDRFLKGVGPLVAGVPEVLPQGKEAGEFGRPGRE